MDRSLDKTTTPFPLWQALVATVALTAMLNIPPRMLVVGKETVFFVSIVSDETYIAEEGMSPALLQRGLPLLIESTKGGEFISKEGSRLFAFSRATPTWIWERVSYIPLACNFAVTGIVTIAAILLISRLRRNSDS